MKRLVAAIVLALVVASPVSAARLTGSISGVNLVVDADADGVISHGDTVTFTVTTNAARWGTFVTCSQNGVPVAYGGTVYHDGPVTNATSDRYGLYSPSWPEGAADCTVELVTPRSTPVARTRTLATMDFTVAP